MKRWWVIKRLVHYEGSRVRKNIKFRDPAFAPRVPKSSHDWTFSKIPRDWQLRLVAKFQICCDWQLQLQLRSGNQASHDQSRPVACPINVIFYWLIYCFTLLYIVYWCLLIIYILYIHHIPWIHAHTWGKYHYMTLWTPWLGTLKGLPWASVATVVTTGHDCSCRLPDFPRT